LKHREVGTTLNKQRPQPSNLGKYKITSISPITEKRVEKKVEQVKEKFCDVQSKPIVYTTQH
jgi:hypothetical protein